jgi:chemotaxis protein methyltransferase CheR
VTLSATAFAFVSDLVHRESAIVLGPGKEYLVESRLLPLARAAGMAGVSAYVAAVQTRGTAAQRAAIVEALTTNETSWFRDREPFDALTGHVLPELVRTVGTRRKINIWSAPVRAVRRPTRSRC